MASRDLLSCLSVIPDPRLDRNKRHNLGEMLFVAVCAVLSGAQGWSDIVELAHAKEEWLRRFVRLDNGIPVDDTFARVLSRITPRALNKASATAPAPSPPSSACSSISMRKKRIRAGYSDAFREQILMAARNQVRLPWTADAPGARGAGAGGASTRSRGTRNRRSHPLAGAGRPPERGRPTCLPSPNLA